MAPFRPPAPVPHERPLGPLALLMTLRRNALECWTRAHFEEPLVKGGFPFANVLVVSDPAAIAEVLVDKQSDYCKGALERRILSIRMRNGLVTVGGEHWARLRRTLAPMFARHPTARFGPAIEKATAPLIGRWTAADGGILEIKTDMLRFALDVLLASIFADGIDDPDAVSDATTRYYATCGRLDPFDVLGFPELVPRLTRLHERKVFREFERSLEAAMAQRRERLQNDPEGPRDILGAMLASKDPETGAPMSWLEIKENIITMIFGGQETTSSLLTWAIYLLSQSPEWRGRVIAEAQRVHGLPAQDAIPKLVQTRAVVEESLRLYPPIIGITKTAMRTTQIASHTVKRGTMVIVSPYVVHRHRMLWRDPDVFDPSRFLPGAQPGIRPYSFLPFGVGPRMCIGAGLAAHEATYALAALASQFEWDLAPGQTVWPAQKNFTLRPMEGLHMRIRRNRAAERDQRSHRLGSAE